MYISDEPLEIIADYFKLPQAEKELFIEGIRTTQMEIFWKSFFIYYAENKTSLEHNYLQKLLDEAPNNKEVQLKLSKLLEAEADNHPEMINFISKKMQHYILNILLEFSATAAKDPEVVRKVGESIMINAVAIRRMLEEPIPVSVQSSDSQPESIANT